MSELTPGEIQARFAGLVGDLDVDPQGDPNHRWGHPAILVRRLTDDFENLAGSRARLLIAPSSENEELAPHGWRTDLRILSGAPAPAGEADQSSVWVIDEAAFYREDHSSAVIVNRSRLWVEELVRVPPDNVELDGPGSWLRGLVADLNEPWVEPLHPIAGRSLLIGSRLVREIGGGRFETNLRSVSPAQMTSRGEVVVAVLPERAWFDLRARRTAGTEARLILSEALWVE